MTTPQERAAAYWQHSESAKAQDHAKAIRATGNRLAAQNDEPEPRTLRELDERIAAEIRAERRGQP